MKKDQRVYVAHMVESINLVLDAIAGMDRKTFKQNIHTQDAVLRRIQVIGESVKRLSEETRNKAPGVPWQQMIGMRNILVHDYLGIDMDTVWDTATVDLGKIKISLEAMLKEMDKEQNPP